MRIFLLLSIAPLFFTFLYAWLIRGWPRDDLWQRVFGICLWLLTALATFAILRIGDLSSNWAGLIIALVSALGFAGREIEEFLLRRLFEDPGTKISPPSAPTK
ncbi:MAG: hypothetical protein AAB469_01690 [Patescibacteria group bacterium]